MRAFLVVELEPALRDQADLLEIIEDVGIEDLVSVGPVEPFDERVLCRRRPLNEAELDVVRGAPFREGLRAELRPVVEPYGTRQTAELGELLHHPNHARRGQ